MSWTSPLTVPMTSLPFAELPPTRSMCGSRWATAAFIVSADCSTNGSCICPDPNSSPTTFIPPSSTSLTMSSAGMPAGQRLVEVVGEAVAVAVDDAVVQALLHGQTAAVGLLGLRRLDVGEHLEQALQRVVVGPPAVPHQVEADLALLVGQAVERHDLAGVDDGRVEPGLHGLVEEHAVERVAGRRVEPEADVGHAERRVRAGDLRLDPPDRLDRVDRVAPQVVVARRERERERVEDQVARRQAIALGGDLVDAVGDLHLPLDVAGLATLVDQQADHRRPVLAGQRHHPVETAARQFAVLEVGRVEDRPAADVLQAGLQHGRLGGVHHQRHAGLGGEALGDLVHVDGAVAADVVDADVEHVGALAHLLVGHLRAHVPVAGEHRVAERLGAVGVGALADDEEAEVLLDRHRAVDRRDARLERRRARAPARGRGRPRRPGGGARASCRSSRRRR